MSRGQLLRATVIALALVMGLSCVAGAYQWSSTKAEFLYGWNYERDDKNEMILTLANATGWAYGDSFFFIDSSHVDDKDEMGGTHMEWSPRLSLLRTLGNGQLDGPLKDVYVIVQSDIDSNKFDRKVTLMAGLSADWNVPGFAFFKTNVQYRDDPKLDGDGAQGTLVWSAPFTIAGQKFSFEGFLDYTSAEGDTHANVLTQPQLLWHATDNLAAGVEYQYWHNMYGIDGRTESLPQALVRWTF